MVTRNRKKEKPYLERDISWMYFNRRILQEATRSHVPLLERMAFLGIYSNNLDEFFRVRVASQSRIAECMDKSAAKEREKAKNLLKQIGKLNARYVKDYEEAVSSVTEDLKKENFLLREKGAGVRDRFEAILRTKDCVIDPLWDSRSTKVLVQAVEDGFGISVLPYCLIEEYLKEGRLAEIKVEDLCLERNLNLVYHPHKVWNDPLRVFLDIVRWFGHDEIRAMKTTDGMFHGQTDTNTLLL